MTVLRKGLSEPFLSTFIFIYDMLLDITSSAWYYTDAFYNDSQIVSSLFSIDYISNQIHWNISSLHTNKQGQT